MVARPRITTMMADAEYRVLCLLHYAYAHSSAYSFTQGAINGRIPSIPSRILGDALANLIEKKLLDMDDPFNSPEVIYSINRQGIRQVDEWNDDFYEELAKDIAFESPSRPPADIPASDRIVTLNHNSAEYKDAIDKIDAVILAVEGSNEYGANSHEEKDALVGTLRSGRVLLESKEAKVAVIESTLMPALKYIANNVTQGALQALAAAGIAALLVLLA